MRSCGSSYAGLSRLGEFVRLFELIGGSLTPDNSNALSLFFRGEFRPRQTRQLPRAVDLKGRLLSCQSY